MARGFSLFRYNRRTSRARGLLFYRLLEQAVRTRPTPTPEFFLGAAVVLSPRNHLPETTTCRGRLS